MATDITVKNLIPAFPITTLDGSSINVDTTTFVGIDFGTSTTVVSLAKIDKKTKEISTTSIWLNQKLVDGAKMSSEKIPTVIAGDNEKLLVGNGAADLKHKLKKGVNVWYSFKMELG